MPKTVFIPLTDEMIFDHPERILGPITPFNPEARRPMPKQSNRSAQQGRGSTGRTGLGRTYGTSFSLSAGTKQ